MTYTSFVISIASQLLHLSHTFEYNEIIQLINHLYDIF